MVLNLRTLFLGPKTLDLGEFAPLFWEVAVLLSKKIIPSNSQKNRFLANQNRGVRGFKKKGVQLRAPHTSPSRWALSFERWRIAHCHHSPSLGDTGSTRKEGKASAGVTACCVKTIYSLRRFRRKWRVKSEK